MPWDPDSGITFGDYMRNGDGRTVEHIRGGRTWATKNQPLVDTPTRKAVQDQLGHVVTVETTPDGRERQHVRINLR